MTSVLAIKSPAESNRAAASSGEGTFSEECSLLSADTASKERSAPLVCNRNFLKLGSHARMELVRRDIDGTVSTLSGWANVHRNPHSSRICPYSSPSIRTSAFRGQGREVTICVSSPSLPFPSTVTIPSSPSFPPSLPSLIGLFLSSPLVIEEEEEEEVLELIPACLSLPSLSPLSPPLGPDLRALNTSSLSQIISTLSFASSFRLRIDLDRLSRDVLTICGRDERRNK